MHNITKSQWPSYITYISVLLFTALKYVTNQQYGKNLPFYFHKIDKVPSIRVSLIMLAVLQIVVMVIVQNSTWLSH